MPYQSDPNAERLDWIAERSGLHRVVKITSQPTATRRLLAIIDLFYVPIALWIGLIGNARTGFGLVVMALCLAVLNGVRSPAALIALRPLDEWDRAIRQSAQARAGQVLSFAIFAALVGLVLASDGGIRAGVSDTRLLMVTFAIPALWQSLVCFFVFWATPSYSTEIDPDK